ncbi:trimeric intracellular cation channel family protein [Tessaracoccus oleiagri]|uniref:Uncharacterized membrane protein YeiH n=1 Tax=Tessaracoccus oleiagri TaxID=686624 RepID=A0A1G9HNH8_9ACTN|nr:TRIC cation channel family protein [Tessaracoccus oleiagri]SDL14063.1 Uncharacterized membrane protein YeiH [Tessaracoccus oleiagri]
MEEWTPDALFRVVDVAGVVGNGLLGGVVARSKGFDLIGFLFLAIASGLGGGLLRDVMLGIGFPVALTDPAYLVGAVSAALIAYVIRLDGRTPRRALAVIDVLALGCWAATGTTKALGAGLGWAPAILLGVITAVGGGMLRDVMVNDVPSIFGGNPLYATVAVVASAEMAILLHYGRYELGMATAILTAAALGLIARWRNWQLPGALSVSLRRPSFGPWGSRRGGTGS